MSISRTEVNRNFHGPVDFGTGNSADYVVAHGRRQRQRGKKPSVSYGKEKNPLKAFANAQNDLKTRELWDDRHVEYLGRVVVLPVGVTARRTADTAGQLIEPTIKYALELFDRGASGIKHSEVTAQTRPGRLPSPMDDFEEGFFIEELSDSEISGTNLPTQPLVLRHTGESGVYDVPNSLLGLQVVTPPNVYPEGGPYPHC
jgi:hypothetical protein